MSDLVIRSDLAERIRQIASQHDQPVEDFLETLLDAIQPSAERGTLAALAEVAVKADIRLRVTDAADRSREILTEEYEKRVSRWMNEEQNT